MFLSLFYFIDYSEYITAKPQTNSYFIVFYFTAYCRWQGGQQHWIWIAVSLRYNVHG